MNKQLSNWIYHEDNHCFYCVKCIESRINEINTNKEFSDFIDYENNETCGYIQDYAYLEEEVECIKCQSPLFSLID